MKKNVEGRMLELISKNRMQKERLKNKLVGIIIFSSTYLLCFSEMFFFNTFFEMKNISGNREQLTVAIFGIVLIIALTSGTSIRSIIYVSLIQQTQEFAKLKMLGATKKQLEKLVVIERGHLLKKYIPIASILAVISVLLMPGELYIFSAFGCVIAVGFILCIVFFAYKKAVHLVERVSPMEVVQGMDNLKIVRKDKGKAPLSPYRLALYYATEAPRQLIRTVFALTLSGILMFSVFSVMKSIDVDQLASYPFLEDSDYILSLNSDLLKEDNDYSYNELMKNNPMTDKLYTEISEINEVNAIYRLRSLECEVINPKTDEMTSIEGIESILKEKEFEKKISKGDMPATISDPKIIPVVVNISAATYISDGLELNIGDKLQVVINTGNQKENKTLVISGLIEEENISTVLYTSNKNINILTSINCDLNWYICTNRGQIDSKLEHIVSNNHTLRFTSKKDVISEYKLYFNNLITAITVFVVIVSIFAFLNLFNVCIANVVIRQKDYTILEAIGMTKNQIKKMIKYENLIYIIPSFVAGCVLGIPVGIFICNRIAEMSGIFYIHYSFPILFIFVYWIFILIVQQAVTKYQNTIIFKDSVINRLHK